MSTEPGLHSELTRKIIGAPERVHRTLDYGFLENLYENALAIELRESGLQVAVQMPIEVRYRGEIIGAYQADLLVEGRRPAS